MASITESSILSGTRAAATLATNFGSLTRKKDMKTTEKSPMTRFTIAEAIDPRMPVMEISEKVPFK